VDEPVGTDPVHAAERARLDALEAERRAIDRELARAHVVQQLLLPRSLPDALGLVISAQSTFCEKLGGDYYDAFWLADHTLALAIADVSGHGIAAALVMAMTRSALRSHCQYTDSPAEVLIALDRAIRRDTHAGMFVTLWLGVLDTRAMSLTYASAGHPYPLLFGAGGAAPRILDRGGFPLGLRAGASYTEDRIGLVAGDLLVLFTDGVVEAKDPSGARLGRDRLVAGVSADAGAEGAAKSVFALVRAHLAGRPPTDDASIVACAIDPAFDRMTLDVASDATSAEGAAEAILHFALEHGFVPARRQAVLRLLVREASANAIRHGNRNAPGKRIRYHVLVDSARLRITVVDEGDGFDGNLALERLGVDTKTSRGRGLFLMRRYADAMRYNTRGNELSLELLRPRAG